MVDSGWWMEFCLWKDSHMGAIHHPPSTIYLSARTLKFTSSLHFKNSKITLK